ncbi:hypothetical protein UlMin_037975 [Ulmus minor]
MLENSSLPENPSAIARNQQSEKSGDGGGGADGGSISVGFGEEERVKVEESERSWLGNRWPRQETMALLKIRSDMDVAFRDSSVKAPLWEEVSRKMGELGYNRSSKKCKEKFENIYKYHRRTKDGRSGRSNGKTYRFYDQLEALDHHSLDHPLPPYGEKVNTSVAEAAVTSPMNVILDAIPFSVHHPTMTSVDNSTSDTSSSSQESEGMRKKKRKLTRFFESLMKEVVDKQERLQSRFIEALEKCERDRLAREEAWKVQELERIKRESEVLVQERAIAAAKDAAMLAFLKKISEQTGVVQLPENPILAAEKDVDKHEKTNGVKPKQISLEKQESNDKNSRNFAQMSSSRWPKEEVEALIGLRTTLDLQYQDNAPKGPLWEEVSAGMKKLGYDRSAKRCKEKWENINKYFKRVKDSSKKRLEDSKTCPYFHQLDALYNKKNKKVDSSVHSSSGSDLRPEELLMHMISGQEQQQPESTSEDGENENGNHNQEGNQIVAYNHLKEQ